jgi:hypothetical protein
MTPSRTTRLDAWRSVMIGVCEFSACPKFLLPAHRPLIIIVSRSQGGVMSNVALLVSIQVQQVIGSQPNAASGTKKRGCSTVRASNTVNRSTIINHILYHEAGALCSLRSRGASAAASAAHSAGPAAGPARMGRPRRPWLAAEGRPHDSVNCWRGLGACKQVGLLPLGTIKTAVHT